jgi:hypothetical protein
VAKVTAGSNPALSAGGIMEIKIDLTAEEWISILDPDADGLPRCCGNVSALRDCYYSMMRDGRALMTWYTVHYLRAYSHADEAHDLPIPQKIHNQVLEDEHAKKMWDAIQKYNHGDKEYVNEHIDHG